MASPFRGFGVRSQMTPQTEPIPGSGQVPNNAGGWSYQVDNMTRLRRFLILNSTNGTYYVGERQLIRQNLDALEAILQEGKGHDAIDEIVRISQSGHGITNDTALFALARCCACDVHGKVKIPRAKSRTYTLHKPNHPKLFERVQEGGPLIVTKDRKEMVRDGDVIYVTTPQLDEEILPEIIHPDDVAIRQYAFLALPKVARTGTHILHFVSYMNEFRGWGHAARKAVAHWFLAKREYNLAQQLIKCQERDKWRQRDLLRLAHPKTDASTYNILFHWVTKGWDSIGYEPHPDPAIQPIWAYEKAKQSQEPEEIAHLVRTYKLPREALPTESLQSIPVWKALLCHMGMEAMIRNLAKMTREGVLTPEGESCQFIINQLHDRERIRNDRLHPMKLLSALLTYSHGKSLAGNATWTPIKEISDALSDAFYLAFDTIEPTGKHIRLIIDISGSMRFTMINDHLDINKNEFPGMTMHMGAAAIALCVAKSEPNCKIIGVDTSLHRLPIHPAQKLDEVARELANHGGGGTSLELPLEQAIREQIEFDAFICLTDSESWSGKRHVVQALAEYRQRINKNAQWIHVQMAPTGISSIDPHDPLALDIVGLDTATPLLVNSFLQKEF